MGTVAAGAVQEAHLGAVWRGKPGSRAAAHTCRPRLSVGIPLQTVTSLPYKLLTVLFIISRRSPLPSNSKGLVKPVCDSMEIETAVIWLQGKPFELKSSQMLEKGEHVSSRVQTASSWSGFVADISTYITSRDSTPSFTWTEHLLLLRKYEKLGCAALKENYRHNRAIIEMKEPVGSPVNAAVPLETVVQHKYYPRTLRERTFRRMEGWRRVLLPCHKGDIFL